jgi:hypothetical protein
MARRRIEPLVTLALGLLMVPLLAEAQTPPKIPRIGILEDSSHWGPSSKGYVTSAMSKARTLPWNGAWPRATPTDSPRRRPSWPVSRWTFW